MTEETALQTLDDIANTNIEVPAALIHELAKIIRKNALDTQDLQRRLSDSHSENARKDGDLKEMRRQLSVVPLERKLMHLREQTERRTGRTTRATERFINDPDSIMIVMNQNQKYMLHQMIHKRIYSVSDLDFGRLKGVEYSQVIVDPSVWVTITRDKDYDNLCEAISRSKKSVY